MHAQSPGSCYLDSLTRRDEHKREVAKGTTTGKAITVEKEAFSYKTGWSSFSLFYSWLTGKLTDFVKKPVFVHVYVPITKRPLKSSFLHDFIFWLTWQGANTGRRKRESE